MGLVVNRKTDTLVTSMVDLDPPPNGDSQLQIWVGGPVEPQRGWLLLGSKPASQDSLDVGAGLYLSASSEVLRQILDAEDGEYAEHRFLLGYAGWAGGQLESELAASAWLTADVSKELIFGTDPEHMWEAAIRSLGINPFSLQLGTGVH